MKKILTIAFALTFVFAGTTIKVSSITATDTGYDIQLDYTSDAEIGGYQFDFLSGGSLTLTGAGGGASDNFDGITTGNNVVLAFSFSGTTLPITSEYAHLVTLSATADSGMTGQEVLLEAIEDLSADTRLIVSDPEGSVLASDFHEAVWTVGSDSFLLDNGESVEPISFSLEDNFPNPFNPTTRIKYSVATPGFVNLSIYDASGRLVKTLVSENKVADQHFVDWDGTNENGASVSAGMYLYKIDAGNFVETKKMLLVK